MDADTAPAGTPRSGEAAGLRSLRWLAPLLVAAALVPFVQELTAQPAVRYAQTAAYVDRGEVRLDAYDGVIGIDRVERDGHIYGDKAPLQPLLAVPAYATARWVGAEPATVLRLRENLGLWWVTLWSTVVPLLVVVALGVRVGARLFGHRRAAIASLVVAGGTLLAAYGTQLYAHVLAGLLGWGAWLVLSRPGGGPRLAAAAGALGGAAVATEYPLALVVVILAGVLVAERSWARLAAFVAGGLPFVGVLLGYQWVAYGSPFTVSYGEKDVHAADPLVVGLPSPTRLLEVLLGARGLLVFSPVVLVAVWGLVRLARSPSREPRLHGIVGLAVVGAFVVMQAGWSNPWGGESPGPRYVIPALPFLIFGLAEVWDRAAGRRSEAIRWLPVVVAWSVFAMATTVVAMHLVGGDDLPVVSHLQNLRDGRAVDTLWTMLLGGFGWLLHLATVVAVGWAVATRLVGPAVDADRPDELPAGG